MDVEAYERGSQDPESQKIIYILLFYYICYNGCYNGLYNIIKQSILTVQSSFLCRLRK